MASCSCWSIWRRVSGECNALHGESERFLFFQGVINMNNRKLLFTLAFLLLALPVLAEATPPPASVNGNTSSQPQPQPQPRNENILPRSASNPVFATFDGIVVQADPMEVKSVNGEVRTFLPSSQEASPQLLSTWPKSGDLVSLTYESDAKGNRLEEIRIVGTTIIGTIKEIRSEERRVGTKGSTQR